ncbi:MAG: hypothetical protein HXY21_02200, partial [Parvularculaceae bacterium]|nr:hypothetical protein [Parvularculaceae bacterium]
MSKKWLILLAVSLAAGGLTACAKKNAETEAAVENAAEEAGEAADAAAAATGEV